MIKDYLNQTISWEKVSSYNGYNEPVYSNAVNIAGRIESGHKLVRNKDGETVTSTAWVTTESAISNGDRLNDRLVVSVEQLPDLDGRVLFYEVYLI